MKSVAEYYEQMTSKKEVNLTQEVNRISSGISGILGGVEGLGIEVPEGIKAAVGGIQSIISILSSIMTITSAIQSIATAEAFKFWSTGGVVHAAGGLVVPGNNFSGDMIPSMINSGELILNQAQQNNIASQLQEGRGGGDYTPSYVSGEQIWIALNNFTKRTGRGEIITWR